MNTTDYTKKIEKINNQIDYLNKNNDVEISKFFDEFLSTEQVCKKTKLDKQMVRYYLMRGKLKGFKVWYGTYLVRKNDLDYFIKNVYLKTKRGRKIEEERKVDEYLERECDGV